MFLYDFDSLSEPSLYIETVLLESSCCGCLININIRIYIFTAGTTKHGSVKGHRLKLSFHTDINVQVDSRIENESGFKLQLKLYKIQLKLYKNDDWQVFPLHIAYVVRYK